ncbi:aldehyde dehydrogenase [Aspergillus aculeatinus CBS 121060]|uniref:Aldehyde dehydrogenase n=1 Tax=Aspergillus aculeatinus CBS 121060 TaxID=1448322 RepID=A0ACD1H486_9EURO|nr:aldehyde dehydrogenase [Aspergillus aculeatinus CBS 121060]RAH68335.1 aldehyde dehydrogenase [Aspergillus aculeatinus CBS 121060]
MSDLAESITAPNGVTYIQPVGLFINNNWVCSSNSQMIKSINPATELEIASVYAATASDVNKAVGAARAALGNDAWHGLDGTSRGKLLSRLADLVEREQKTLATIETMDNGKPYKNALGDIAEVFNVFRYYAGWADKQYGQTIETSHSTAAQTIREPIGVCAQIIPWNYPLGMASWKLGPALACGNTVVIKAAEQTPLSILYLANLIVEAGFPPGVVNILNGYGKEAGSALVRHPEVDKVAFTGSTETGKEIMKMASENLTNITLETGGKSPLIVFDDAYLDNAIQCAHYGVMGNMGQICTSTSRIFVHEDIYDTFCRRFVDFTAKISIVGDPFEVTTYHGPQVSKEQSEKILSFAKSAKDEGAVILTGGSTATDRPNGKGFYVAPTIVANVHSNMTVYKEEIFGPLGVVMKFRTEDEVIALANETKFGLAAAVCTRDIARAHRMTRELRSGMVWINCNQGSDYRVPFGGVKQSGIGRELGPAALEAYSQLKSVFTNLCPAV